MTNDKIGLKVVETFIMEKLVFMHDFAAFKDDELLLIVILKCNFVFSICYESV